ncbi:MAG: MarP family serine protease [Acidimicrobiales bacterium]
MNLLDLALVAILATSVWGGWRLGLVAGGTSWVFLVQGLVIASLLSPLLVDWIGGSLVGLRLLIGLLLFLAGGIAAQLAGRWVGTVFRRHMVPEVQRLNDRLAGAVGGPVLALLVLWLIVLPPMREAPGWTSNLAEGSAIGKAIRAALPDAPDTSNARKWLTATLAQPEVLTALGPAGDSSPPPTRLALSPEVVRKVSASTVRIEGDACFLDRSGSGFVVADDLVVTNAHVVAGGRKTAVIRPDGTRLAAVVAVYDPEKDLALLRVRNLGQAPLPLGTAKEGSPAAVFGHPKGQDELEVSPAAIRQELTATIRDADLTNRPVRRNVYVLAADLAPGDSGGALVTPAGQVAGVAFAVSNARSGVAFAITTDELLPLLEQDRSGTADTGRCF